MQRSRVYPRLINMPFNQIVSFTGYNLDVRKDNDASSRVPDEGQYPTVDSYELCGLPVIVWKLKYFVAVKKNANLWIFRRRCNVTQQVKGFSSYKKTDLAFLHERRITSCLRLKQTQRKRKI
ncbi:uncharacterized protein LOC128249193 [Octopus bimaculoides]|uniref:uncharacterized protein LOC128249193 n=1 Tax=Octopus bimaculoides TaxID=37653 RepID=UPI0022E5ECE0|nr:uncharacterized protein LOC128249193 [Octopus bimaculoides]